MTRKNNSVRLKLEALEARETPSVTVVNESFDAVSSGLPTGWTQRTNDASSPFGVAATGTSPTPVSGTQVLSYSPPLSSTNGIAWNQQTVDEDATVAANVFLNSVNPVQVLARGSNLNTGTPTYYAATLTRGLTVGLVKVVGGTTTGIASPVTTGGYISQQWVRLTLDVSGTTVKASVQRLDTNQYLTTSGTWQTAQTWAVTATDSSITTGDLTGIGRFATEANPLYFDDFRAEKPDSAPPSGGTTYAQAFDTTTTGTLPTDWAQWSSDGTNRFAVSAVVGGGNPIYARSAPNALAFTPPSSTAGRAWYNVSQAANVTASVDVYLNNINDSLVFARGSNLSGTTPTYYAANLSRGLTAGLSKVVAGTETALGSSVTSTDYVSQVWATLTLDVQGTTVRLQVQRRDTNQYLTSLGTWQTAQAWAVTATDSSITAGGFVGLSRDQGNANATSFDNFSVTQATSNPPTGPVIDITTPTITTPIQLSQDNTTYRLQTNVTATGTAFVVTGKNVTLDLNGFTVTYGNAASPALPNSGFETALPSDATKPANWDLTGAPTAHLATARTGMWGTKMLQITSFSTNQTITSDWVNITDTGREYAAVVTPRSNSTSAVSVQINVLVETSPGVFQVISSGTASAADVGRGFSAVALFAPAPGVTRVKIQIVATLAPGATASLDLDRAEVLRSRDFGIMATTTYSLPAHLTGIPNYTRAENFIVKNGTITQGAGKAYKGNPIYAKTMPGIALDGVTTVASGMDTDNLFGQYASDIDIRNSTFNSTVDAISKRMVGFGAIRLESTSGELYIGNNTILNSPMTGIYLVNHLGNTADAKIIYNTIQQNAFVSDGYAILINGLSDFEIGHNTIQPTLGRGILFDGFNQYVTDNGNIHDNVVEAYEKPNLEYGPEGLEATALRLRNYGGRHSNLTFQNNTFYARTDGVGVNEAIAARITFDSRNGQMAGANNLFVNNTFRAVVDSTDPIRRAYAVSLAAVSPGTGVVFQGNVFESNYATLAVGDKDTQFANEDVTFVGNTRRKSTLGQVRSDFVTTVIGGLNHAAYDIRFISEVYDTGTSSTITYVGTGQKRIGVGSLLTVNVTASGVAAPGASVIVYDKDNQPIATGTTDSTGQAVLRVVTSIYRQTTTNPASIVLDARGPFRVSVTRNSTTQDQTNIALAGNTILNFAF